MRNSKCKLSQQQWEEHNELVLRLIAGGADLNVPSVAQARTKRLKITQAPEMLGTYVCDGGGRSFYIVSIRIVALTDKVVIQHFDVSSPEWGLNASLLGDPAMHTTNELIYRVGHCASFSRDEVLNHRVDDEGILHRNAVMQGVLLAESFDPIPERYVHGSMMRLTISIWDQFDEVHERDVQARVEYSASGRTAPRPVRSINLFEPGESRINRAASGRNARHPACTVTTSDVDSWNTIIGKQ